MMSSSLYLTVAAVMMCFFGIMAEAFMVIRPERICVSRGILQCTEDDDDDDMYKELSQRIESVTASECIFEDGLRRRVRDVATAEAVAEDLLADAGGRRFVDLPVIAWNTPLLPCQSVSGMTADPTFSTFLRDLGLGGLFVLISVNSKQKRVRRSGVVVKIESVDVDREGSSSAVKYLLKGTVPCRLVGPPRDMAETIGRFRKCYDPNGEEPALGWDEERFTDSVYGGAIESTHGDKTVPAVHTQWPMNSVCCLPLDEEEDEENDDLVAQDAHLLPLLDQWIALASDPATYRHSNVAELSHLQKVDAERLVRTIIKELGPRPPPMQPRALAFWGAALINSDLFVTYDTRGAVLEAANATRCVQALERGLNRSLRNLLGLL